MPDNKTKVAIDPKAADAARKRVSAAQEKRRAIRRKKHAALAAKFDRLTAQASRRREEVRKLQRNLARSFAIALKQTRQDFEFSEKVGPGQKLVCEQCGDRPLRLLIETEKPQKPKDVAALIAKILRPRDRAEVPNVEYLFPRLIKKTRDLRRFLVVDLKINRRRGLPIAPRIADAVLRSGRFLSVRIEGLRSGATSGPPLTGTGPNYEATQPARRDWHLTDPQLDGNGENFVGAIDAYGAWEVLGTAAGADGENAGAGVVIGHPDTGYRPHTDYPAERIDTVRAYDAFTNASAMFSGFEQFDGIGQHPFTPTTFPYIVQHGTFTASVIVAPQSNPDRDGREMVGVAPGATMLPLRCVDTVILAGDLELIRAIEHAIFTDVDVISISLGGAPHPALHEALRRAVEAGIIVVAAAGQPNGAPLPDQVVAPAAWPEVIAVGGSIRGQAWFGCFSGPEVDFCAPAVVVERARFNADGSERDSSPGTGTSFATALTAGVAALWLQHHGGRAAIQAAVPGVSVQRVFRHLARATAYRPSDLQSSGAVFEWPEGYGTGILNARRLLEAPLPAPSDVPGYNRFVPPNIYVVGSGIAIVDLNGRPVLDGVIMLTGLAGSVATGVGAAVGTASTFVGDFIANATSRAGALASAGLATWLGAVGSVRSIGEDILAATQSAETWEQALAVAGSVAGEVGDFLEEQAEQAEEAWNAAEDALDEALEDVEEALDELAEDTAEFLEETADEASETASEIVEDVVGVFGGLFG